MTKKVHTAKCNNINCFLLRTNKNLGVFIYAVGLDLSVLKHFFLSEIIDFSAN